MFVSSGSRASRTRPCISASSILSRQHLPLLSTLSIFIPDSSIYKFDLANSFGSCQETSSSIICIESIMQTTQAKRESLPKCAGDILLFMGIQDLRHQHLMQ
jgi:hypothetical protein